MSVFTYMYHDNEASYGLFIIIPLQISHSETSGTKYRLIMFFARWYLPDTCIHTGMILSLTEVLADPYFQWLYKHSSLSLEFTSSHSVPGASQTGALQDIFLAHLSHTVIRP